MEREGSANNQPEIPSADPGPGPTLDTPSHLRLLIVDDNLAIHDDFRKVLCPQRPAAQDRLAAFRAMLAPQAAPVAAAVPTPTFDLTCASQGLEAVERLAEARAAGRPFSVAFLDVRMPPGIDGIETAERLWSICPDLQVVICSAYSDYSWEDMVRRLGAGDRWVLMRKPFDPVAARQLASAMAHKWKAARAERMRAEELEGLVASRTQEVLHSNAALRDEMHRLERAQAQIDFMAHHDTLTTLPNRRYLDAHLRRCLSQAEATGRRVAVMSVDIDHFKRINDSLGHLAGDEVLRQVAGRLKASLRGGDLVQRSGREAPGDEGLGPEVARFGGDEFVVVLHDVASWEAADGVARRIAQEVSRPLAIGGHELQITTSIGISLYPEHGREAAALISNADAALHHIKRQGRGECQIFRDTLTRAQPSDLALEAGLIRALRASELELFYQPIFDPMSRGLVSMEALIRWNHPEDGLISPGLFLPMAEELGLINQIGEWVTHTACVQARRWVDAGLDPVVVSVNVSARQLASGGLDEMVAHALRESRLPARHLVLELTETALITQRREDIQCLERIADMGVKIALDDFGTGYSSLKHLVQMPIHCVKIDGSFVRGVHEQPAQAAVVRAVIGMAASLGLSVVAEGVEDEQELAFLAESGCRAIQGYLFSRPIPARDILRLLDRQRRSGPVALSA